MDRENDRCQVFDVDDNYLTEWPNVPGPNDAVIDDDGIMHIATGHEGIHVMSLDGKLLGTWNQRGESLPQYNDTLRI
ncbi:MAG: hypothetical protein IH861_07225 [Chloroflexi bacterium]|nr:hypothetical protein [Chloroflexota bacterium]